jgi:AcrR family transcriptional regulator
MVTALTEEELRSPAQRERRKRILDATLALASKGGYEAVQMRAVAEQAEVALGTLYRYFPSKDHLLVSAMAREFGRALQRQERGSTPGDTSAERVLSILARTTRSLQRDPMLTEAMTRAVMSADTTVAAEVAQVGRITERMFTLAMSPGEEPSQEHRDIARVIGDVWLAGLVAWVTRRAGAEDVRNRLELTVRLLLAPSPRG